MQIPNHPAQFGLRHDPQENLLLCYARMTEPILFVSL
jgi:hypothetical protein